MYFVVFFVFFFFSSRRRHTRLCQVTGVQTCALPISGAAIEAPAWAGRVDHEAELGLVISRTARNVKAAQAYEYVAGLIAVNDVTTRELIFTIPELVEFISSVMTLLPGDIISTGTPSGFGPIRPGDNVTVHVEG